MRWRAVNLSTGTGVVFPCHHRQDGFAGLDGLALLYRDFGTGR
jgi:hypothetical protein